MIISPTADISWIESLPRVTSSFDVRSMVWATLQHYLDKYDSQGSQPPLLTFSHSSPDTQWKRHAVVVETLLTAQPPMALPLPLLISLSGSLSTSAPVFEPRDAEMQKSESQSISRVYVHSLS